MLIIKEYLTAVKLDEENKLLFAYDIKNKIIDEQSEGILSEVSELIIEDIFRERTNGDGAIKSNQRV